MQKIILKKTYGNEKHRNCIVTQYNPIGSQNRRIDSKVVFRCFTGILHDLRRESVWKKTPRNFFHKAQPHIRIPPKFLWNESLYRNFIGIL